MSIPVISPAHIVMSTAGGTNYTGANGVSGDAAVTFVIENTTNDPFLLMDLEAYWQTANNNALVELWYTSTSLSGPATITSPAWTSIITGGPISVPSNGYYPTFSNIALVIPPNTTYRFALRSSIGVRYSGAAGPPTPSTFSSAGLSLHCGDYQISSLNVGYGGSFTNPANTPRWFTGSVSLLPMNVSEDIGLTTGELRRGDCLSNNDTVSFTITNVIGSTIDLSVDSVVVHWEVTGPVLSSGTVVFNTDTLPLSASKTAFALGVDMSVPGIYQLNAYIDSSAVNELLSNDTLTPVSLEVMPVFSVSPASDTIYNNQDSVEVNALSPFLPAGTLFMTEICHFKTANGAPSSGWPAYLVADDYIELTGVPYSDIGGITLEQWTTTMVSSYTFPPGTFLSPQGTAVIAVGQMGSSVESPSNFYYHGNGAYTGSFGSTGTAGRILKDANGNIIDAVVYGTYTFPVTAGVTPADWSGNTPALSSSGNRLEGAYTKDATNWVNSGSAGSNNGQDPNVVNQNVTVPTPQGVSGFTWSVNGVVVDTIPSAWIGPFSVPGTYYAVASYISPCGILSDSVMIIVDFPYCFGADSIGIVDNCAEIDVSWVSGQLSVSSDIEYGPIGFSLGSGTVVSGVTSPATITGITPGAGYDLYIIDSCSDGVISPGSLITFTAMDVPVAGTINFVDDGTGGFSFTSNATGGGTVTWLFGDGNSATGDSVFHQYAFGGTYNVVMIIENSCGADTATVSVTFVGVDVFGMARTRIYPNPSNGAVTIDNLPKEGGLACIRMNDMQGRAVFTNVYQEGRTRVDLNIEHLRAGTYYLTISNNLGSITKPVILVK
jgi:hypothetical protein